MKDQPAEIIDHFIEQVKRELSTGSAREHSYRPALKTLFEMLNPNIIAVNEPARTKIGAPDFQIEKSIAHHMRQTKLFSSPPLAFVEAKDITESLDKPEHQEQLMRYFKLGNILHTNCLTFRFYINGQLDTTIELAELKSNGQIIVDSAQYHSLSLAFNKLLQTTSLTVSAPSQLAKLMAERAQAIRDIIQTALTNDVKSEAQTELAQQFRVFQSQLVHDLDEHKFADLYAQTLAYGLFAARYNDKSLNDFTLIEAAKILPPTNQFLRKFFREIAGYESENRINWVLDNLVEVFNHVNVRELMKGAGEVWAKHHDPIIHFYETFLGLYDPMLRKNMGVYYTPQPVVKYIVRAIDDVLKREFGIADGLSDTSKIQVEYKSQPVSMADKKRGYAIGKKPTHRVQILDPALGTGTFLNEVIKLIAGQVKPRLGSQWSKYVESDLLPRLYGFEIMMAPYAMANLRLNLTLAETGYKCIRQDAKLQVLLTNSLEEPHTAELNQMVFTGFQQILATEAQEADIVKSNHRIMVVVGNPPYSGVSSNETIQANSLVASYKVEPGGTQKLQERKHWLNDDYVKFIAFAEDMIIKNGEGVVAMITNNGYLDNPTFRGMRWHLRQSFDKIYVLDLHGNAKKKETAPDGGNDENVFDIMQGVSIILAVKTTNNYKLSDVYHADIYGKRKTKYDKLNGDIKWRQLIPDSKNVYFVPKDTAGESDYAKGIKVNELFTQNVTGIVTMGDNFIIDEDKNVIAARVRKLANGEYDELTLNKEFGLGKNYARFVLDNCKDLVFDETKLVKLNYRPFDERWTYFDNKVVWRWREKVMSHFFKNNIGLVIARQCVGSWRYAFVSSIIGEFNLTGTAGRFGSGNYLPLYLYHDDDTRTPNFKSNILKQFTKNLTKSYDPENILDYIYAVLYSPKYREIYNEFLKIDFPRVPVPANDKVFENLGKLGKQLRLTHLLQDPELSKQHFLPTGEGDWIVQKVSFVSTNVTTGNVYINDTQYFAAVPLVAYNFYIGGYQPAQKWLKDRKKKVLTPDDVSHYQKIIAALTKTIKLQTEIDQIWHKS